MNQTLIAHLQLIYHCLKGNLDAPGSRLSKAEHMVIISKLTEDIDLCTEGFRNRVNDILHSLVSSRTLSELLYQARVALVKNIGYELTQNIHAWNRVIDRAILHGLGIKKNAEEDPYPGHLADEEIDHTLREKFEEKYTPFNLVFLLTSQLDGILLRMGYTGPQQDGYSTGTAEKIGDRINCYLAETEKKDWKKFFIIDEDDDFNIVIRDLNWQFIRKCFLQTLIQKGYFSQTPSEENIGNLLHCAYFSYLFCENNNLSGFEERYITHQLFNRKAYLQLEYIKMNFPIFWQKLSSQHLILFLISELEKKSFNNENDINEKIKLLFALDLKSLTNDNQDSVTLRLLELIKRNTDEQNLLMWAARNQSNSVTYLIELMKQYRSQFDNKILENMYSKQDSWGINSLMLAARYQPEAVKPLLESIALLDEEARRQLLLQKTTEGLNLLMLAACYQPEAVKPLLESFAQFNKQARWQFWRGEEY
ncbi:hypothetical protein [Rickettsiella endosymbiont of Rhagonycha lignosa]|uniref:hypothetical protein n=1 Tax=Rickettsiella endosymbiont of Rhagonycha lignosa TaxID=3077937 RepID=UPI00313AE96B